MTTRQYFAVSLLLPVVLGLLGRAFQPLFILWFMLVAGAIEYLPLAIVALVLIWRARAMSDLALLSGVLPIVFSLFLGVVAGLSGPNGDMTAFAAGISGLLVGYLYVGLAWAIYLGLRAAGLAALEFAT